MSLYQKSPLHLSSGVAKDTTGFDTHDHRCCIRDGLDSPLLPYRALDFLISHGFALKIKHMNGFAARPHPGHDHAPVFLICRERHAAAETHAKPTRGLLGKAASKTSSAAFYRRIGEVHRDPGRSMLMASHKLQVVMSAPDRMIRLNGQSCREGTPEIVVSSPENRAIFGSGDASADAAIMSEAPSLGFSLPIFAGALVVALLMPMTVSTLPAPGSPEQSFLPDTSTGLAIARVAAVIFRNQRHQAGWQNTAQRHKTCNRM